MDRIYLTTWNSIITVDFEFNFIKDVYDIEKFKYLSDIAYSIKNNFVYACDCTSKMIHIFDSCLDSIKSHQLAYEPLKIEILNDTMCIMPHYDCSEINCLHLYDIETFNFIFNFEFDKYGPLGTIGSSHFCLYDFNNEEMHLIQHNGYFNDSISIKIDKKKFHLCDKIFDLNNKLFITSSINEKVFFLSNNLFE